MIERMKDVGRNRAVGAAGDRVLRELDALSKHLDAIIQLIESADA